MYACIYVCRCTTQLGCLLLINVLWSDVCAYQCNRRFNGIQFWYRLVGIVRRRGRSRRRRRNRIRRRRRTVWHYACCNLFLLFLLLLLPINCCRSHSWNTKIACGTLSIERVSRTSCIQILTQKRISVSSSGNAANKVKLGHRGIALNTRLPPAVGWEGGVEEGEGRREAERKAGRPWERQRVAHKWSCN